MGSLAEHVTMSGFAERRVRVECFPDAQKSTLGITNLTVRVSDMCNSETVSGLRETFDLRALEAPITA